MIKVNLNGTISGIRTLGETNCLGLNIHTQELPIATQAELLGIKNLYCEIELKADDLSQEVKDIKVEKEEESKTPSKRLRDLIFVLYKAEKNQDIFDTYYKKQVDKICEFVKQKIAKIENPL